MACVPKARRRMSVLPATATCCRECNGKLYQGFEAHSAPINSDLRVGILTPFKGASIVRFRRYS
jgi:hypothetical protein